MQPTFDFTDQAILITGAGGGIGSACARLFRDAGAHVILTDIDKSAVERVAVSLGSGRGDVIALQFDASDSASIDSVIQVAVERFGHIDHLVPAAGIYPDRLVADMADDEWRRVMAINLDGIFMLLKRAIPKMRDGGSIVTVASVAGHRGSRGHSHYAASKAGVIALTRSLAVELGPRLRINAVSPGTISTQMISELLEKRGTELISETPLGRNGYADEVASVIAFLLSDAASYVHGEVIHVNGGLFLAG